MLSLGVSREPSVWNFHGSWSSRSIQQQAHEGSFSKHLHVEVEKYEAKED